MSKKVFIRRKEIHNHLPKEIRAEAVSKLSSVYVNRQPLKGFNPTDEKKYLNGILDVSPDHPDWPKHSKLFWAELTIPVGFTGVELEIGTHEDGTPLRIMDWLKYQFAIKHPYVAMSEKEMTGRQRFYILDTTRAEQNKFNAIQLKKDADKEFIKIALDLMPEEPWNDTTWDNWTAKIKEKTGRKGKDLFLPLREAFTGMKHGPEMKKLIQLLGRDKILERVKI